MTGPVNRGRIRYHLRAGATTLRCIGTTDCAFAGRLKEPTLTGPADGVGRGGRDNLAAPSRFPVALRHAVAHRPRADEHEREEADRDHERHPRAGVVV